MKNEICMPSNILLMKARGDMKLLLTKNICHLGINE